MSLTNIIQKLLSSVGRSKGFGRLMNDAKVLSAEPGKVKFEMEVTEKHLNPGGTLHGGMICLLIDNVSTYAVCTTKDNKFGVSVDLNVSFLSAAYPGEKIIIESEVQRAGKKLAFTNTNIFKEDGKLLATGRHTKYLETGVGLADFKELLSSGSEV